MGTKISWADETWNVIAGCSHASAGCDNCYAEKMANRLSHMKIQAYREVIGGYGLLKNHPNRVGKWNDKTVFVESALEKPLHWKTPRNIFVCSMSDLFHPSIPFEWIDKVFAVMWECYCRTSGHTFQLLTKRPEIMARYYNSKPWTRVHVIIKEMFGRNWGAGRLAFPGNVWLGVTAENQEMADERIPILLQIPAQVRFASVEPMLGPVDLKLLSNEPCSHRGCWNHVTHPCEGCGYQAGKLPLDWCIIGAESGPKRRKCEWKWADDLVHQCQEAKVPVFVKQIHHIDSLELIKSPVGWPREFPEISQKN